MTKKKWPATIYRRRQFSFRVRAHEAASIEAAARAARVPTAEWIRYVLLKATRDVAVAS